jgi:putative transposon-encoded protein
MRIIELNKGNLSFKDKIEGFLERIVTPIGNSAKADIPKRFIGRRVYILISENESRRRGNISKKGINKSS